MQIKTFIFNPFYENTYLLYDKTKECVIIDAGCYETKEEEAISNFITENQLIPVKIINTHCHIDHVLGNNYLMEKYGTEFITTQNEVALLEQAHVYGRTFGISINKVKSPTTYVKDQDIIKFGKSVLKVLEVPGHTTGHIALWNEQQNSVFVGDVLFKGSIGRTDLPGGNYDTLINSIKEKLLTLNPECVVYSGHGNTTTIGYEKFTNQFLNN